MTKTMRVAGYESFGDPAEVLKLGERPVPEPGPGEIRVKTALSAIHNHDLWTVRGAYGVKPKLPAVGGSEACGTVDALGDGVTNLKVGQRVAGFATGGAWAEYFLTSAVAAIPLPDAIADEQGCQLVAMPLSAMALLRTYTLEANQLLIQNTANGAVGKTLAVLAKQDGIRVIHLVRNDNGVRELEELGITDVVSTASEGWKKTVRGLVGDGKLLYGIDSIGGKPSGDMLSVLSDGGTLVVFGSMSGEPMEIDSGEIIFKRKKVDGFWMTALRASGAEMASMIADLVKKVATGALKLPVAATFDLAQCAEAASASIREARKGKVVLRA
jgi:NADPH2:quinone reductase